MLDTPSLGYLLKRLRERKHYTQQEVIEKSGLDRSSSYISSLETNKTSPTMDELDRLAVLYGTTLFDLISEWKGVGKQWDFTPSADIQMMFSFYQSLNAERKKIALEFTQFLAEKQMAENHKNQEPAARSQETEAHSDS